MLHAESSGDASPPVLDPTDAGAARSSQMIVLVLIAVAMLTYFRPLLLGDTFAARDHLTHTLPAKTFLAESLRAGHLPEWWDGIGMGVPFAANPNHSALYPGVWPMALLPMPWAIDFILILHLAFAGIGLAFFSRRLGAEPMGAVVAGAAFMLCGYTTSTIVHGGPLLTLAWTPWIAWAADRLAHAPNLRGRLRDGAVLAVLQAAQLYAGDPSFVIISGLLAFGVICVRAREPWPALASLTAAYAAAVILAAVVIIPALYLLPETARAAATEGQQAGVWSMHPARIVELVWPGAFGDPNDQTRNLARAVADSSMGTRGLGTGWALGLYLGLPALLLAAYGFAGSRRRDRWFGAIAAAFVILALGRYTPIYGWFRAIVLPERLVRYPEKHLVGALVLVCAFAGLGMSRLLSRSLSRRAAIAGAAMCAAFAVLVGAAALARVSLADRVLAEATRLRPGVRVDATVGEVMARGWSAVAVLAAFAAAVYLLRRPGSRSWAGPLVAAIVVGDLVFRSWGLLPLLERDVVTRVPPLLEAARDKLPYTPRLYRPQILSRAKSERATNPSIAAHETAIENTATRFGFAYLRGYDQALSAQLYRLWHAAAASGKRMLDLYAVDYAILPVHVARAANLPIAGYTAAGDVALVRNPTRRPRAFVAPSWQWHDSEPALIDALFPPPKEADARPPTRLNTVRLLGRGDSRAPAGKPEPTPECKLRSSHPERVVLACKSPAGGYAVLLDSFAPGWSATVDGEAAAIERADMVARAVRIGAGEHRVVFRYRTPGLRLGGVATLLGWLNLLVLVYILRRWRLQPT